MYRCEMEKLRKQDLAVAKRLLEDANDELEREEERVTLLAREFNSCQENFVCIDDVRMYSDFFYRKRAEIVSQKEQIQNLDQVMNEKRADLIEATKDKKVLESLKEKKIAEFRQIMTVRERHFLDEISIQKKVIPT